MRSARGAAFARVVLAAALLAGCAPADDAVSQAASAASDQASQAGAGASTRPETPPTAAPTLDPAPTEASSTPALDIAEPQEGTALALLATLPVKGRAPKTGYDRDNFGTGWGDPDRNGCDTRNDMLARDLTGETFKPGTNDCVVVTGTLADPYTGTAITFVKADANAVHIDHVVALSDAWQKGAQQWEPDKRRVFANDPLNLLAVDGPANMSKSDGDAATWLPPNKAYRCPMVARQVAVKAKYELWVTQAEKDAIERVLGGCPGEPPPTDGSVVAAPPAAAPPTAASPLPPPAEPLATAPAHPGAQPADRNCGDFATQADAQAFFDQHYPSFGDFAKLDGEGDMVSCESLP